MLNAIIRFALKQRLLVVAIAIFLVAYGGWQAMQMEIDVFPNLNRPRVVVMTEAHGMAPEEVETLITFPLESALNGANGVQAVRSSSGVGISVIYVEFDWGTDIYTDRQIVNERIALAAERLPEGINPQLAPISSIMGQIVMVGMWSETGETDPMEVRTLADWVVRQRLLTIPGVSQVFTMGGQRKQYQVLVDPDAMLAYGVSLHEIKQALNESNLNATGGYLDEQGPNEFLVRALGRVEDIEDLRKLVVAYQDGRPIPLARVARVVEGPQIKRGDSSAFKRNPNGEFSGGPAVVLTINKQPEADTLKVTNEINDALAALQDTLPPDVRIASELYSQKGFIDRSIANVEEAMLHGGILVVIILVLFLMNLRTTFITLTSIPVTLAVTFLIFKVTGMSINTMTLGGLAVAIGELMDDAIVDVENIFRRLRENRHSESPKPALLVVFQASTEIRNSIVFGTMIVVIGFVPLFALGGMEGRLFTPLGIAYVVSILSSLIVSLTLTPVLSYWLLSKAPVNHEERDGLLIRVLKVIAGATISFSLKMRYPILIAGAFCVLFAGLLLFNLERDFLPPFNEGTVQLNAILPPGTSLQKSNELGRTIEERLLEMDDVETLVRRTGRAELDEHAEGVNVSEILIGIDPESPRSREEILGSIRETMEDIPGVNASTEQPLAHLIGHMLSGVKAQIGVKLYGDDLNVLRRTANEIKTAMQQVEGTTDLFVEPQVIIPQLRIEIDRDKLLVYGLTPADVNEFIETAMNGEVVSSVLEGQRTFDLLVRLDEAYRENLAALGRLSIDLPGGGKTSLASVARLYEAGGPNTIKREQVRRRIVIQCNVEERGLVDVVEDIQQRLKPIRNKLPSGGYFIEIGGQYESQQSAMRLISILLVMTFIGIFLVLYTMFRSVSFSVQVMAALPMAFIGSTIALVLTGQTLTIAAMVGFISLGGIASRNGILLLNHYIHLVRYEGETWSPEMIIRAGKERLAPVLMTALTSGVGLIPLVLAAGEPGKEILYPVATVHIGGLISCTILEFLVRPALFWTFASHAGEGVVKAAQSDIELVEESAHDQS